MKEITKEEVLNLKTGTEYIIYNPLTKQFKVEIATPVDIAHNKHCYEKLKFYIKEDQRKEEIMETQEVKDLKRCIKKLKAKVRNLESKLQNNEIYTKELEEIEPNKLISLLRNIKAEEILDFNYSCQRTFNGNEFEDSLDYNIYVKRIYKKD